MKSVTHLLDEYMVLTFDTNHGRLSFKESLAAREFFLLKRPDHESGLF